MAIETRNGRSYYYESKRVGARVVKEYKAAGSLANLMATLDESNRILRKIDRDREQLRFALRQRVNAKLRKWLGRIDATVADAMAANGWHQHNREWRRKRGYAMGTLATTEVARSTWVPSEIGAMATDSLSPEVKAKAKKGDRSVLPEINQFLDNPAALALFGDVGRHVLLKWVMLVAGDDLIWSQALLRFASDLRTRLAGANPTALDYLLAERVVIAWVFVNFAELQYAAQMEKLRTAAQAKYQFHRMEMANRNLMAACRTLAKVKKAKLPDVLAVVTVATSDAGKIPT